MLIKKRDGKPYMFDEMAHYGPCCYFIFCFNDICTI